MTSPDFYILGAPKCGTQTLDAWLRERDDVFLQSPGNENFHAKDIKGRLIDPRCYEASFDGTHDGFHGRLVGETSSWYLYSDAAVPAILEDNPHAHFIVCLHDPAELAWALHSDYLENRIEHVRDFNTAWALSFARREGRGAKLTDDPKLLDYASICALGLQVARLLSRVPRDQVHFVFLEDLQNRPELAWKKLEHFLGLRHHPRDAYPIEDFVIHRPLLSLHEFMMWLKRTKRKLFPGHRTGLRIGTYINGLNRRPGVMKPMPEEARQKVSDKLSEDIATLSVLTDRDLLHWIS